MFLGSYDRRFDKGKRGHKTKGSNLLGKGACQEMLHLEILKKRMEASGSRKGDHRQEESQKGSASRITETKKMSKCPGNG